MKIKAAAGLLVGALAGGLAAAWLGPRWRPTDLPESLGRLPPKTTIRPANSITQPADPGPGSNAQPKPAHPIIKQLVRLRLAGETTVCEITRPDIAGRCPAVVFAHGAGTGNHTAFMEQAHTLAQRGIASLVPDRHKAGYSATHRNYAAMSDQYAELANWARQQDWVDPGAVGYWGESEGAWMTPAAATQDLQCAFMVLISAPTVPPREQAIFSTVAFLENTAAPAPFVHVVPRLLGGPIPAGAFKYADWQIDKHLRNLTCPVFMGFGTGDSAIPLIQGPVMLRQWLGQERLTVRYYNANHGLRSGDSQRVDAVFLNDLADWLLGLPATAQTSQPIAGAAPTQKFWISPPAAVPWFGRLAVQGGLAVGSLVLAGLGLACLQRLPRRLRQPFGLMIGQALAAVFGFAGYLVHLAKLTTSYQQNHLIVQGGYWLLRALSVGCFRSGWRLWRGLATSSSAASGKDLTPGQAKVLVSGTLGAIGLLS
ncbi:MAG: prolyl oligopeptidase family serine peptidase, partial [Bifidobacteriaceae bacterium]|nr:prolyl oligopeptidase family serine peptidase [Bifidobacteriaceae bacterium]